MKKQRGFTPILILVILLTFGVVGFVTMQSLKPKSELSTTKSPIPTNSTTNWKTYINDIFNFKFDYPSGWNLLDYDIQNDSWQDVGTIIVSVVSPENQYYEGEPLIIADFSINIIKGSHSSIEKEANKLADPKTFGGTQGEITNYKKDNLEGKVVTVNGTVGNLDRKSLFIKRNNYIYNISLLKNSQRKDLQPILDQILSTFQFTKATPTPSPLIIPSNWKNFTAEDSEWDVTITISLPTRLSFKFDSGAFIINDTVSNEGWSLATSFQWNGEGKSVVNTYTNGSLHEWYRKHLEDINGVGTQDKIISFEEKNVGAITYSVATIEGPRGYPSQSKIEKHYLYVQNNIVSILRPISEAAHLSTAVVPKNILEIFHSLKVIHLK